MWNVASEEAPMGIAASRRARPSFGRPKKEFAMRRIVVVTLVCALVLAGQLEPVDDGLAQDLNPGPGDAHRARAGDPAGVDPVRRRLAGADGQPRRHPRRVPTPRSPPPTSPSSQVAWRFPIAATSATAA